MNIDSLRPYLVLFHAAWGGLALLTGVIPIVTKKGGRIHKRAGTVFRVAMYITSISGFLVALHPFNPFLLAIATFTFYMNYTGVRWLHNPSRKFSAADSLFFLCGCLCVCFMFYTLNPILLVFGALLLSFLYSDGKRQWGDAPQLAEEKKRALVDHLGRMLGTYLATWTAFLVVNVTTDPQWLVWLAPTFIILPLIIYWVRAYKKKLGLE